MAHMTQRLTQADVNRIIKAVDAERAARRSVKAGLLADGGGLYLQRPQLSYISRLRFAGRRIEPGHGSARRVKLAEARTAHETALRMVRANKNPITEKLKARTQAAATKTFMQAVRAYLPTVEAELKSDKTRAVWRAALLGEVVSSDGKVSKAENNYCGKIHHVPIAAIDTPLMLAVLNPIWSTKPETASRLRGRIERVLSWAVAQGMGGDIDLDTYRNPARWDGHLEHALATKGKVHTVEHHAALDHTLMPEFYAALAKQPGLAARAFQLAILTAARTGDLRGVDREDRPPMRWEHVDLKAQMWTIPRTKTGVAHRIPLSTQAVALLEEIRGGRASGIVFTGGKPGQPMSNGAMLAVVKRMTRAGLIEKGAVTPHGMARAGFKSWASDETNAERNVIEACLSHAISDQIEAAYRRTDFYAKRAKLMQDWADYVTGNI